ncbi:MAG: hypothetical protein ABI885_26380 [Gammaproteobacteria bacterium]
MIKLAKPCVLPCTRAQLIVEADWHPTWNKPIWIRDANLNQTDFNYYESGSGRSLLQQARRPAVGGICPTYTFTYNGVGKV